MRESWLGVIDRVLRPARPDVDRCVRERATHLEERRRFAEARAVALADCAARIEAARAVVFAANDGIVTKRMTELEREWRALARTDADAGIMDLWARIAPAWWLDRKLWRDSAPASRVDAAIALAADVEGVAAAERALASFREALAAWGTKIGTRVRWRYTDRECDDAMNVSLLEAPLAFAQDVVSRRDGGARVIAGAHDLAREVLEGFAARHPTRPMLGSAIAQCAYVDALFHTLGSRHPNPTTALRALWATGYGLAAADASGVTLEIPPL